MREMKKKTIGSVEYQCAMFPPQKSLKVLTRIGRVIGQPLQEILSAEKDAKATGKSLMDQGVEEIPFGKALSALGDRLGDDDLYDLIKLCCESVIASPKKASKSKPMPGGQLKEDQFDLHFTEFGLSQMFKVFIFSLEANYQDFFADAAGSVGMIRAAITES